MPSRVLFTTTIVPLSASTASAMHGHRRSPSPLQIRTLSNDDKGAKLDSATTVTPPAVLWAAVIRRIPFGARRIRPFAVRDESGRRRAIGIDSAFEALRSGSGQEAVALLHAGESVESLDVASATGRCISARVFDGGDMGAGVSAAYSNWNNHYRF
jgi:hypothetical protein